ncbi:MAG TPA: hypothetical protein PKJ51_12750, partial [Methanothrix sp.]|nr:hypothetical protein [Methanothrix sp.]
MHYTMEGGLRQDFSGIGTVPDRRGISEIRGEKWEVSDLGFTKKEINGRWTAEGMIGSSPRIGIVGLDPPPKLLKADRIYELQ